MDSFNTFIDGLNSKHFAAGISGGMLGTTLSHPLDTIRINYQEKPWKSPLQCASSIYSKFGPKGFYKGYIPPLIGVGLEKCIVFGSYNNIKNMNTFDNYYKNVFYSGTIAGLLCTTIVTPVERIKILVQTSEHKNTLSVIRKLTIPRLYIGWTATLFREVPGFGLYFCTYEYLKNNTKKMTPLKTMLYGGASGMMAWLFIYPSDPIKTKMQHTNIGIFEAAGKIVEEHGFKGFYRGFSWALYRAIVLHAGVFLGYETFMNYV